MNPNRREFMASLGALAVTSALKGIAVSAQEAKKYRACVIGDWENGQYGHQLHLAWKNLPNVEVVGLADPHERARAKFGKEADGQSASATKTRPRRCSNRRWR